MICAEVSIYPLKTSEATGIISNSIESLNSREVEYTVGSISTHLHGSETQVWDSLQQMFRRAGESGEVSMVVTISNAAD
jgi:uncharacterized protein YqgV (UPF0045/DUF77 family)